MTALRKRVKELRGAIIAGSISTAGAEDLKKEIAYHEAAMKSAEREKKRMEALAKARESKIAKSKAKKEMEPVEVVTKKVSKKVAEVPAVAVVEKVKKVEPVKKVKKVAEVVTKVDVPVLSKNIRSKKVKDASEDDE